MNRPLFPFVMTFRAWLAPILALALCLIPALLPARPPNIVFVLADDLGHGDLPRYGAIDVATPHIDRIAEEGVHFTRVYAMGPECTPSRTSILTGRYPQRVGGMECAIGTGNVGRYDDAERLAEQGELGLPSDLAVLAPALKAAGYHNGVFGKWHLGYEDKFSPLEQGFDEFAGFLGGNVDYFRHIELSDLDVFLRGREPVEREGYLTDLITRDGLAFLEKRAAEPNRPFFLYLPHAAPHFPFQGPEDSDFVPTEENWLEGTRDSYVNMIERLDHSIGRITAALEEHGFADNTLLVFASDHGAIEPGSNAPFRDYKTTLFEGGLRVPLVAKWPGRIEPGTVSGQTGTLMDLTASFLNAAGAEMADGNPLDGIDLLGHVAAGKADFDRTLHWRSRRDESTWWAISDGTHKWIRHRDGDEQDEWFFDLSADPGEQRNLLEGGDLSPEVAARLRDLRAEHANWESRVAPAR